MEELNKKTLLHIFLGLVLFQASVLLAISANFLLAQTDPDYSSDTTSSDYYNPDYYSDPVDYTYDDSTYDSSNDTYNDTMTVPDTQSDTSDPDYYGSSDDPTYDDGTYDGSGDTYDDTMTIPDTQNDANDPDYYSNSDDPIYDDGSGESYDDTTITDPLTLTFAERFEPPFSGDQRISIISNQEVFSCVFKIYGPKYAEFSAIKDSPTNYYIILHTKDFPDGYYTIKAVAGNNIGTAEIRLDVKIENQIAPEPDQPPATEPVPTELFYPIYPTEPIPTETVTMPYFPDNSTDPYYPELIYTQPEQPVIKITPECQEKGLTAEECLRYNQMPPECVNQGITNQEECDQLMKNLFRLTFECKNANITSVEECDRFMVENFMPYECKEAGITTKEECDYLLRNTYTSFENFSTAEVMPPYTVQIEEEIPDECKKQGITSFEECKKHIMLINMPEECRQAGATNPDECEKIMFKKHGPQECIQAQIFNPEECEKFMFKKYPPDDCQEAGILNPEACKRFMFEKYSGADNIPEDKFPIECQKANVRTIEECDQIMKKIYLPQECKEQGIEDERECERYLNEKHMPWECREAGAKSRSECDKIMFKKFGPPECQEAGIEDEQECHEFMFNKYAPKVKCDNLEDWQCNNFIKDRHLGNIVAKQVVFTKIKEGLAPLIGKTVELEKLEEKIGIDGKIIPLKKDGIKFRIIQGTEELTLNEEDNLIQTAPIILMIDSDGDGLPDDVEKRFGTDPFKADTDEDGCNDGEEIKNGHNPLGKGVFERTLAPIEKAIMENKPLSHPITEGEEVENFFVENISNAKGDSTEGYILSGKAKLNSVATLYIYSDLPIVVTVNTDQYGNWQYQLDQSLIEGEHEVYVAINDDTGKVIEKSKPLNFFVKEASAVSVKDFVSVAKASSEESKKSEVSIYYYLLITLFIAMAGIFLFLSVIISRKKNQPLK
jgi:hypothetical protein